MQITITGTAQHAAWRERTLPPVKRLDGGLWSVPVPIPDSPLRYTLCYLLTADDGLVVVDPGWDTPGGWTALLDGLATAGAAPSDVTGVVATHVHPDHHGLTARLRDASGAWVAMHPAERDSLPQRAAVGEGGHRDAASGWLRRSGAPEEAITELVGAISTSFGPDGHTRPMAEPDLLLDDGDLVPLHGRTVRVLWTPGHTPGHLCLHLPDDDLVLTGDHVLPRITPNIGLQPLTANPPLADFLTSLDKIGALDGGTTDVLPAHEYRFQGLALRTRALQQHHERRCQELLAVVADLDDPTLWQITERLTWSRPWAEVGPMRIGALAETGAHVQYLTDRGDLRDPVRSEA